MKIYAVINMDTDWGPEFYGVYKNKTSAEKVLKEVKDAYAYIAEWSLEE